MQTEEMIDTVDKAIAEIAQLRASLREIARIVESWHGHGGSPHGIAHAVSDVVRRSLGE